MKIKTLSAIIAGLNALQVTGIAQAQNDNRSLLLEEVVVTAQKREQNVLDVPIAITVVGSDQLADQRVYGLADLARTSPALEMVQAFGGPGGGGQVRGVGTNSFTRSAEGAVGIVVDGVPQGNVPNNAIFDLERVEVLKGPQGTLFGLTASAGVINMATVAPDTSTVKGYVQADYSPTSGSSEFGQKTVRAAINVPLTEHSALRVAANYDEVEGVQHDAARGEDSLSEETAIRARYLLEASESVTINLIADYSEGDENTANPNFVYVDVEQGTDLYSHLADCGITPSEDNNERCLTFDTYSEYENFGFSAQVDIEFEAGTLTSITGYRKREEGPSSFDIMADPQAHDQIYSTDAVSEGKQISQEIRFSSNSGKTLEYTAGLYYYKYEGESSYEGEQGGFFVGVPSIPPFLPFCNFTDKLAGVCHPVAEKYNTETTNEAYAAFGQATYHINEQLSVLAGLRYTDQELTDYQSANLNHDDGIAPQVGETSETDVSGKIGIQYSLENGTMLFATYTRGYKGPQVVPADMGSPATVIAAEIPKAYEIGAKGIWGERVGYEATVFYNDVTNYQGQSCGVNNVGVLDCSPTSISSVISKGVELNFFGDITEHLSINAGYIYNVAEYPSAYNGFDPYDLRVDAEGSPIGFTDLGGEQIVGVPEHKVVLNANYTVPLNGMDLVIGGDAVYKDDVRLGPSADERFVYEADWNLSARVSLEDQAGRWRVQLFARNITENREPATLFGGPDYVGPGADAANPNGYVTGVSGWTTKTSLRQIGLSTEYRF
ncbi:TonB-dependent receptor [Aestuariicella hydrocarbonica]|uniref:TonB-dependent receptor n=1 Tax=Pseudomaricurvus hydrocarbonicus TaxID=1470433 RepID=A0A9E5JUZ1_9GAMM|nr:TonB-dependent receptor [Aestuariicella hydrocarbonica]NHO65779.1 TonB-dependent receptor [Aestuariicella hydrocarbonica]